MAATTTTSVVAPAPRISAPPAAVVSPEVTLSTPVAPPAPAPTRVLMPDVMCMNLQDAQDLIQANGVFFSRSADASGKGRKQVLDANWIVVGQQPSVGAPVGEAEAVLSVVKIGEPSPC
ncbi:hypothetical protein [Rhodococcus sp. BE178]|uniref:hypothetical protein n=1 Tax=Rhodococcus sp. BE178 TaxID=2817737 RepID=UPI003D1A74E0